MKVKWIMVILRNGTDLVCLHVNLPDAILFPQDDHLTLTFSATKGTGKEYCKQYFPGIPVEVVQS